MKTTGKQEASAGKAKWTEVSDSYVKARFTCPGCRRETFTPICELIRDGLPCACCGDPVPAAYTGLFALL